MSKSKVAGTHGMPEGAEMVLSSFEVEVGPTIEAHRFRYKVVSIQACWLHGPYVHACIPSSALNLPQLSHLMHMQIWCLLQQTNRIAHTADTCSWWRNSLSCFCPSHSWHRWTSSRAAAITAAGDVLCNVALSVDFRHNTWDDHAHDLSCDALGRRECTVLMPLAHSC